MLGDIWKVPVAIFAGLIVWQIFGLYMGFLTMFGVGIYLMSRNF